MWEREVLQGSGGLEGERWRCHNQDTMDIHEIVKNFKKVIFKKGWLV